MRKYWIAFMIIHMMVIVSSISVIAEKSGDPSDDYQYVLMDNGNAEIKRYKGKAVELEVPEQLDGHAVTRIGSAAFDSCSDLTKIILPESVTSIGYGAFSHCENLTDISMSENVASIEDEAFSYCSRLTNFKLPESIDTIGANPFLFCDNICFDVSPDHSYLEVIDGVLFSKPDKRLICAPNTKSTYEVPDGIQVIGDGAFYKSSNLKEITLPESVTDIGNSAFSVCISLTDIELPEKVTSIGYGAFAVCNGLTSISLPEALTSIGEKAFFNCPNLTRILVSRDSYAAEYCEENGLPYAYKEQ